MSSSTPSPIPRNDHSRRNPLLLLTLLLLAAGGWLVAATPASAQWAEDSHLMLRGSTGSLDVDGPLGFEDDSDGDGFLLDVRWEVTDEWFVDGHLEQTRYGGFDLDIQRFNLGGGFRARLIDGPWRWTGALSIGIEHLESEGPGGEDDETGATLTFEIVTTTDPLELRAFARYTELDETSGPSLGLAVGYEVVPRWFAIAGFERAWLDESTLDFTEQRVSLGVATTF